MSYENTGFMWYIFNNLMIEPIIVPTLYLE